MHLDQAWITLLALEAKAADPLCLAGIVNTFDAIKMTPTLPGKCGVGDQEQPLSVDLPADSCAGPRRGSLKVPSWGVSG